MTPRRRLVLSCLCAVLALSVAVAGAAKRRTIKLTGKPAAAVVNAGASARYVITVRRSPGLRRAAVLRLKGLPAAATASWQGPRARKLAGAGKGAVKVPAKVRRVTLVVATRPGTPPRAYRLALAARAGSARRTLALGLTVRAGVAAPAPGASAPPPTPAPAGGGPSAPVPSGPPSPASPAVPFDPPEGFGIAGGVAAPLHPGASEPIALTITNPRSDPIAVTGLHIAARTTKPGCDAATNYVVTQVDAPWPLIVPPGTSALADLVPAEGLPSLTMPDLAVNQNACKSARVTLDFTGTAAS